MAKKIFFKGNKYSSFSLFKYDLITQRRFYGNIQLDWCSRAHSEFVTIFAASGKYIVCENGENKKNEKHWADEFILPFKLCSSDSVSVEIKLATS